MQNATASLKKPLIVACVLDVSVGVIHHSHNDIEKNNEGQNQIETIEQSSHTRERSLFYQFKIGVTNGTLKKKLKNTPQRPFRGEVVGMDEKNPEKVCETKNHYEIYCHETWYISFDNTLDHHNQGTSEF